MWANWKDWQAAKAGGRAGGWVGVVCWSRLSLNGPSLSPLTCYCPVLTLTANLARFTGFFGGGEFIKLENPGRLSTYQ